MKKADLKKEVTEVVYSHLYIASLGVDMQEVSDKGTGVFVFILT